MSDGPTQPPHPNVTFELTACFPLNMMKGQMSQLYEPFAKKENQAVE